jgi:hypothetical protein
MQANCLRCLDTDYKQSCFFLKKAVDIRKPITYIRTMKRTIPKAVREYMASLGRKGGKAKDCGKGFNSQTARAAVMARWNKSGARKSDQTVKP